MAHAVRTRNKGAAKPALKARPGPADIHPMHTPAPPLPPPARRRMAALGIVGSAMVAVPLVQVLRFETAEMQAVVAQQASLDPIARAVAVQYSLLAHRDAAGLVLRGQAVLEPERRLRQGEVDDRLIELGVTLETLHSYRAVEEAQALAKDWAELAQQVSTQHISADASDAAHRLRVEQAVQVMDLVADAGGLHQNTAAAAYLRRAHQAQAASIAPAGPPQQAGLLALHLQHQQLISSNRAVAVALAAHQQDLQHRQRQLRAVMASLALLAVALGFSLARAVRQAARRPPIPQPPADAATSANTLLRAETGRALARLRQPAAMAEKSGLPTSRQDT